VSYYYSFEINLNNPTSDDLVVFFYGADVATNGPAHCMPDDSIVEDPANSQHCAFSSSGLGTIVCSIPTCYLSAETDYFVTLNYRAGTPTQTSPITISSTFQQRYSEAYGYTSQEVIDLSTTQRQTIVMPFDDTIEPNTYGYIDTSAIALNGWESYYITLGNNTSNGELSISPTYQYEWAVSSVSQLNGVDWTSCLDGPSSPSTCSLSDLDAVCTFRVVPGCNTLGKYLRFAIESDASEDQFQFDIQVHQTVDSELHLNKVMSHTFAPYFSSQECNGFDDEVFWFDFNASI